MKINYLKRIVITGCIVSVFSLLTWSHVRESATPAKTVEVTYFGNCGFLVQVGGKKILFDLESVKTAFDKDSARAVYEGLKEKQPPFDDLTAVLISHAHADHVGVDEFAEVLRKRSDIKIYSTEDNRNELKKADPGGFEGYARNVIAVDPFPTGILKMTIEGIEVEILGLYHAGAPDYVFKDLSFVLSFDGVRIFYLSDIAPEYEKNQAVLKQWAAAGQKVDLLFSPDVNLYPNQWSLHGYEIIKGLIRPGRVIAMHLDPKAIDVAEKNVKQFFPEAVVFRTSGERRIFR